jgi:protein involved in polysaccharide export with SLBB domain
MYLLFPRFLNLLLIALLLLGSVKVAQAQAPGVTTEKPAPPPSSGSTMAMTTSMDVLNDKVKLGTGDRVSFRVVEDRREPIALFVTDSGEMEIPYIGRVTAAKKTCKQLANEIKPLLEKEYFYRATVIIGLDLIGVKSRGKVYVTGQVHSQGALEIQPDEVLTVSKAILRAGGLADFANKKKIKLVRKQVGGPPTITVVDLAAILEKGQLQKDPVLEPDDVLIVPERLINF